MDAANYAAAFPAYPRSPNTVDTIQLAATVICAPTVEQSFVPVTCSPHGFPARNVRPEGAGADAVRTFLTAGIELQARSILGLAIDTIMISPGAAQVIYADREAADRGGGTGDALADAPRVPESDVRVFGHLRPGDDADRGGIGQSDRPDGRRRLGVAVVTAADVTTARDHVRRVSAALRKHWQS